MPTEIVLLPIIESAYRPEAYSPSHAAGIWQLIPGTGKRFGLRQSAWYDGRRDVLASTIAALDYLQNLHDLFKRDWLHALAAYNCGEKTVQVAIHRNRRAGRSTSFWSLDLPAETKKFVPKLLAMSSIVAAPAVYNVNLKPIANKPYVSEVEIGAPIRLARAAALAQMSVAELRRLNPGVIQDTTGPTGPHRLALPVKNADILKREIARSVKPPLALASTPNFLPAILAVKARRAGASHDPGGRLAVANRESIPRQHPPDPAMESDKPTKGVTSGDGSVALSASKLGVSRLRPGHPLRLRPQGGCE